MKRKERARQKALERFIETGSTSPKNPFPYLLVVVTALVVIVEFVALIVAVSASRR